MVSELIVSANLLVKLTTTNDTFLEGKVRRQSALADKYLDIALAVHGTIF